MTTTRTIELPKRPLIDTNILISWMKDSDEPSEVAARQCIDRLLTSNARILIAAPTIAEMLRRITEEELPRTKQIEVVAFDNLAAIMTSRFPMRKDDTAKEEFHRTRIAFDPMIIACAMRHKADCLITSDVKMKKLAERISNAPRCILPSELLEAQMPLLPGGLRLVKKA